MNYGRWVSEKIDYAGFSDQQIFASASSVVVFMTASIMLLIGLGVSSENKLFWLVFMLMFLGVFAKVKIEEIRSTLEGIRDG